MTFNWYLSNMFTESKKYEGGIQNKNIFVLYSSLVLFRFCKHIWQIPIESHYETLGKFIDINLSWLLTLSSYFSYSLCQFHQHLSLHKKSSFPLKTYSVNVTKSAVSCGFGFIYWRMENFIFCAVCYVQ